MKIATEFLTAGARSVGAYALQQHALAGDKLHADDTPVPVLAPGEGKTKTGRQWTYVRDDCLAGDVSPLAVWFAYSRHRYQTRRAYSR